MQNYNITKYEGTVYCLNGKLHCTEGPAIIETDGKVAYYINGILHRTDGPAIIYPNGFKLWAQNGILHRTDGPAIESPYESPQYWVNGNQYSENQFNELTTTLYNNGNKI